LRNVFERTTDQIGEETNPSTPRRRDAEKNEKRGNNKSPFFQSQIEFFVELDVENFELQFSVSRFSSAPQRLGVEGFKNLIQQTKT